MSEKAARQQARQQVAAYHEEKLAELVAHVAGAIDQFRAGDLGPFDMDRALFQYSRAAKKQRKYCNLGNVEAAARYIREDPAIDWWERGSFRER